MIVYDKIIRHDNVEFSDYLEHHGLSTSFLKREINGVNPYLEITDNIRTGSLVDAILTDNGKVNMNDKLFDSAIKISKAITSQFGTMIKSFETQISYTCDMEYNGFVMQSKGRLDYLLPNMAVVDLKVTQGKDTKALIEFMGYKNQLWHYAKMAKVNRAYIMIHSVPLSKTEIHEVDVSSDFNAFWASKIEKFGKLKTV